MFDQASILQEIQRHLSSSGRVWVGFSGGLDSTVLLHYVSSLSATCLNASRLIPNTVRAVHVNHQLSPQADQWQQHCENIARTFGIALTTESIAVENHGQGIEQSAREGRYRVFESLMQEGDVLLLGHHSDDQAETLLYRLMRGAGLAGLSAMPANRTLAKGTLSRPLLPYTRAQLRDYAHEHDLQWVEDESNNDAYFDRNFIRNDVFALIKKRWPKAQEKIAQSARWLFESNQLLNEYGLEDLALCEREFARFGERISLVKLEAFSHMRQKHILRSWCEAMGFSAPDAAQLGQVSNVVEAKEDAVPCLSWGDYELRRYQQHLYLLRAFRSDTSLCEGERVLNLSPNKPLELPDGSRLFGKCKAQIDLKLEVRFRQSGIRCKPRERGHSQSLKKLFQEYRLEPWLRERIPLIYSEDQLIAVGDLFQCEHTTALPQDLTFEWLTDVDSG